MELTQNNSMESTRKKHNGTDFEQQYGADSE